MVTLNNDVQKPDDATLILRRILNAAPELAFKAWTSAEHIQQWMCPEPGMTSYGEREVTGGGGWPLLQEAQYMALSVPNTGMATAIDIGDRDGVHPLDKLDVGIRLALVARHLVYGENLVYSGPMFDKMTVEGSNARISFTQTGSGLIIGSAPWTPPDAYPIPTDKLVGFVIAGADQKFYVADAKIDGTTVVVSSPQVPNPTAVRYDFATITAANLYNKENLPAFPFRTDKWDNVNSPAVPPQMVPPKPSP
jgi:hypothetical protein